MDNDTLTVPELTVPEFAEKSGRSRRTVNRMIKNGDIKAHRSAVDGRRYVIPITELSRLLIARQNAADRALAAGAAAGALDARWRVGYRQSVPAMAVAGVKLAKHLADAGAEHEADRCGECAVTIDELLIAAETARGYAAVASISAEFYREILAAGRAADEASAALGNDGADA